MNQLTDIDYLKSFLKSSSLRPKDYMGQNFLVDENALKQIITTADLKKTDTVLEVGPGLGELTEELIKRAGKVIAVEKDERLCEILKQRFWAKMPFPGKGLQEKGIFAPEFINQDILRFNLPEHITGPYKVVANIPYYLTSKLFQYFLNQTNKPQLLVLMVQKEVGERVVAKPGSLSILGISVQIAADAEIVGRAAFYSGRTDLLAKHSSGRSVLQARRAALQPWVIPKTSFWPVPKVDSVILKITPKEKYPEITDEKLFFSIIKKAFAGKRKQLHNTLGKKLLTKAGIDQKTRPQELSIDQWIKIYKASTIQ